MSLDEHPDNPLDEDSNDSSVFFFGTSLDEYSDDDDSTSDGQVEHIFENSSSTVTGASVLLSALSLVPSFVIGSVSLLSTCVVGIPFLGTNSTSRSSVILSSPLSPL